GVRTASFAEPELVHWTSFDGRAIPGFLYKPLARFTGRRPVIVNIHGGPEGQSRPGFIGRNNYYLRELGVAILYPNIRGSSGYRQDLRRVEYGDERDSTVRTWMERSAPLNNADRVTRPLLVVQGMNDPRVPRSEAEHMVTALERRNVPVWYLMAKDEGHGFRKKANADFQFYATVLFVKRYLLGQ